MQNTRKMEQGLHKNDWLDLTNATEDSIVVVVATWILEWNWDNIWNFVYDKYLGKQPATVKSGESIYESYLWHTKDKPQP